MSPQSEGHPFTGKEEDVEVGLVYFGKRFLSPALGRWVSADPLGVHVPTRDNPPDLNLYAYVKGHVLTNVDPVGLQDTSKKRQTIVMLWGNPDDTQAKNMDAFCTKNYGQPGSRARQNAKTLSSLSQTESRMTVGSSGMGPYDIVNDLTAAANRLNRERRLPNTERSIQLPAHGGPLGIGREEGGIWLTHADLWSANQYRTQLEKAYKKWILGKARGDADLEATGMREFKNLADHPGRPLYEALQDAASAMEAAGVDYVELQACKTSTEPPGAAGVDSLGTSVNPLLGRLLSTYSHQVKVLGHSTQLDTEAIGNKVTVTLGGTPYTSSNTLPVPEK